jgi:hypothetical protein
VLATFCESNQISIEHSSTTWKGAMWVESTLEPTQEQMNHDLKAILYFVTKVAIFLMTN